MIFEKFLLSSCSLTCGTLDFLLSSPYPSHPAQVLSSAKLSADHSRCLQTSLNFHYSTICTIYLLSSSCFMSWDTFLPQDYQFLRARTTHIVVTSPVCLAKRKVKEKKVKWLSRVRLCDPVDCSLPGSSLHGILQARVLEWVAIAFSRGSSQPRDRTRVSCIAGKRFKLWATREALPKRKCSLKL